MRPVVLALTAVCVLAAPGASQPASAPWVAFVSAEDDDAVVAVGLNTRSVLWRRRVADGPHNVTASSNGRAVVVTSPPAGRVTVLDGRTGRVRRSFSGFAYPHDVELSANGRYAWVTDERRGRVVVLDLRRGTVSARIRVPARPHDIVVTDRVLVTHSPNATALTMIDPDTRRVIGRIAAGRGAHDISFQPDSANVFLTFWGSGVVAGLDLGSRRMLFRRRAGALIHHLAFDYFSGAHVWATDHVGGRVLRLSARTGRTTWSAGGCPGAHHVSVGARSGRAVVACHDSGRLLLVGPGARTRSVAVGRGLHGVAVALVR